MSVSPRGSLLRHVLGRRSAEEARDERQRAADQKAAARWEEKAERRGSRIAELEAALARTEAKLVETREALRRKTGATHRVLADLFHERARWAARAVDPLAAARERTLVEASAVYARTANDPDARRAQLARVESDAVSWWVPDDPTWPERRQRMADHGFPLQAIMKTRVIPLGGVMVDVGANIGRTSIPRVMLGDVRAVYAAEPEPANFACLVENVIEHGLCGVVLPDQLAVGPTRGEVRLRRSRFSGGHRVLPDRDRTADGTVIVPQWPLEAWLQHMGADCDAVTFIKVDTQGAELGVLLGAGSLLERPHVAWQIEIEPKLLARAGTPVPELLTLIAAHFSHFLDIGGAPGVAPRSTREMGDALAYVGQVEKHTDVLVYHGPR